MQHPFLDVELVPNESSTVVDGGRAAYDEPMETMSSARVVYVPSSPRIDDQ